MLRGPWGGGGDLAAAQVLQEGGRGASAMKRLVL